MALVQVPYLFEASIVDNNNERAPVRLRLPAGITTAEAQSYGAALATAVAALTNGQLRDWSVAIMFQENAPTIPGPESEVERKAQFSFRCVNGQIVRCSIPSPDFGLEIDGSNTIDLTGLNASAFVDLVVDGPVGLNNSVVSNAGSSVASVEQAYVTHRHRKP